MNKLKSMKPMSQTALGAFIFFLFWRVYLIMRFKGLYAFDEMYHISSSDAYFHSISEYDRAPYLNWTVRFLSSILGRHYYTYKLIPFVLCLISIGSLLYLSSKLFQHQYNIILFTLLCSGHCLLIFNHLYVRMYVWDEAVISLLAVILYKLSQTTSLHKRIGLHILYFAVSAFLFVIQPGESSSIAVLGFGVVSWCLNYTGLHLIPFLEGKKLLTPAICLLEILVVAVEFYVFPLRLDTSIPLFPDKLVHLIRPVIGYNHITSVETPIFSLYFVLHNVLLPIGLLGFGYLLLKNRYKNNNLIGIYSLALLPFLAYNMLYFDRTLFRGYAAYLPVLIFIAVLWLDSFQDTVQYRCISTIVVLITILLSNTGLLQNPIKSMTAFYQYPYIYNETSFNDYGGMIMQARQDIADGRKCISIWPNMHQQAAFELDDEYSVALENSLNVSFGYTAEDIEPLRTYLSETNEPYILLLGPHTTSRLNRMDPDIMLFLYETYPYKRYGNDREGLLFYIN